MAFEKSKKYVGVYKYIKGDGKITYYIFYKENGKQRKMKIGDKEAGITEVYCFQKRNEILHKLRLGEDPLAHKKQKELITFKNLAKEFLEHKKHLKIFDHYKSIYKVHLSEFDNKEIGYFSFINLKRFRNAKLDSGLSNKRVNLILELLNNILNYSCKIELIKENPITNFGDLRLKVDNKRERFLTKNEVRELFEATKENQTLYLFVKLSLNTGGRIETILNIKFKDVDFENKSIQLEDFKNSSFYDGYINDEIISIIKSIKSNRLPNDFVVNKDGLKLSKSTLQNWLRPLLNKLFNKDLSLDDRKNRVVIHTLRHTFASHLAINGVSIYKIQKLMNHKDISQTMRYAKLSPDSVKSEVENLF